jgi:hypothetical protein
VAMRREWRWRMIALSRFGTGRGNRGRQAARRAQPALENRRQPAARRGDLRGSRAAIRRERFRL